MSPPPLKILIVEDDSLSRGLLERRLRLRGYETMSASNGAQAIAAARSELPDLILMDLDMPVMDGWVATRTLKEHETTRNIPIIALTAHALSGDREKAIAAGCDDYDTKPLQIDRLQEKMQKLLTPHGRQGTKPAS